ncbi:MAG: TorF family putative porin [Methylococcales bacterium]|nr:TorF family putative porin [Methylococcales bacterium]
MKKIHLAIAISLLATSSTAFAEEDGSFYGFTPSASVALTTDYMWRGVSQSNNDPAIQGSFDLSHETGFYMGVWGSNVEFGDQRTSMELDAYAGFSRDLDLGGKLPFGFNYDIGVMHYEYTASSPANFTELYFGGTVTPFDNFEFSAYYYYGLKIHGVKPGEYTDLSARYTFYPDAPASFSLLAHAGYYNQKDTDNFGDDYWDWKLGVAVDVGGFNFEVAYLDTDNPGGGGIYGGSQSLNDSRIVATISRELGGASAATGSMLPEGFETSASVALTTDYVWRGISQSNNEPSIQGSFDLSHESGAYIGVWGSNVEYGNKASLEVDVYAGFSRDIELGGMTLTYDLGWLRYEFPSESDLNFNELYFGATVSPMENLNLSTYFYYGLKIEHTLPGEYTDMSVDYTLPESLGAVTFLGHAGYYNQKSGGDNYWDWKVGVARDFGAFNLEVAYTDTDDADAGRLDDAKAVATLSASF